MPLRSACSYVPQHWVVCALCSLALAIVTYKNTCFYAVADIVASVTGERKKPTSEGCPFLFLGSAWGERTLPFELPDVYWNKHVIRIQESAFLTGKFLMIIPAGMLSDLGFTKSVLNGGMLLVSVSHLVRPFFVNAGLSTKVIIEVAEGMGESTLLPAIISLTSRWTPPWERNFFTAVIVAGYLYGDTLGHLLFNLIYVGTSSWSSGHFITGVVGVVWLFFSFIFIYHAPDESPFISPLEFRSLSSARRGSSIVEKLNKLQAIPWRQIVSSPAFLSLVLVFCSLQWASNLNIEGNFLDYQTYILRLPEHLSHASTATIIVCLPMVLMGGILADWINKRSLMSKIAVKRVFTFISLVFSSIFLVSALFVGCNVVLFWILSVCGVYIRGLAVAVIYCNPIDLSPRHSGLLTAIMHGAVTICAIFDDKITWIMISDVFDTNQWRLKAVVCGLITITAMIPFLFFGSVERQHWRTLRRMSQSLDENPPTELETADGSDIRQT